MLEWRDTFSGNILLYDNLSEKPAPFLNRNLQQAFKVHEHLVNYGSTENCPEADNVLRSRWQPPSRKLLDIMIARERTAGSFVLEVHSIRLHGTQRTARADHDDGPAKKGRTLLRSISKIKVSTIFTSSESLQSSEIQSASVPAQEAILRGAERNIDRHASVETDPITIKLEDLAPNTREISQNDSYKLMMSVGFDIPAAAEELYNYMGLDVDSLDTSSYLSASYENILDCPQGKILLPLKAATKQLGINLEVSMYWADKASGSVLFNYNRHLNNTVQSPQSYPTPPLDVEPRYRLTFVYGTETLVRSELVCLHCFKRRASTDIEDLQMHLISWHENFQYQATLEGTDQHGVEHWRFESEVADHRAEPRQRASAHADGPLDVRVRAPARPFDRKRFLNGDDGYQRAARIEKPSKSSKPKATVDFPMIAPIHRQRKPTDQVQPRPHRQKKTYVVPRAPSGITFFRSSSKRPLRQGEAISESDDELDEGWLHLRKDTEVDKEGLSETATRFLKLYDDFMHDESPHSNIHAGDALIRFARDQAAQIWQEGLLDELKKKLAEMLEDNIISPEVHAGALGIVTARKPNATEAIDLSRRLAELDVQHDRKALGPAGHKANKGSPPKKDGKGKDKAIVRETGHLTPITADSDGDVDMRNTSLNEPPDPPDKRIEGDGDSPYDLCYCGEDASATPGSSGIIACSSIVSHTVPRFHKISLTINRIAYVATSTSHAYKRTPKHYLSHKTYGPGPAMTAKTAPIRRRVSYSLSSVEGSVIS
jgi:hypothetical protein